MPRSDSCPPTDLRRLLRLDVEHEEVVDARGRAGAAVLVRGELEVIVAAGKPEHDAVVAGVTREASKLDESDPVGVELDNVLEPVRRTRNSEPGSPGGSRASSPGVGLGDLWRAASGEPPH